MKNVHIALKIYRMLQLNADFVENGLKKKKMM